MWGINKIQLPIWKQLLAKNHGFVIAYKFRSIFTCPSLGTSLKALITGMNYDAFRLYFANSICARISGDRSS